MAQVTFTPDLTLPERPDDDGSQQPLYRQNGDLHVVRSDIDADWPGGPVHQQCRCDGRSHANEKPVLHRSQNDHDPVRMDRQRRIEACPKEKWLGSAQYEEENNGVDQAAQKRLAALTD